MLQPLVSQNLSLHSDTENKKQCRDTVCATSPHHLTRQQITRSSAETLCATSPNNNKKRHCGCDVPLITCNKKQCRDTVGAMSSPITRRSSAETLCVPHPPITTRSSAETLLVQHLPVTTRSSAETLWVRRPPSLGLGKKFGEHDPSLVENGEHEPPPPNHPTYPVNLLCQTTEVRPYETSYKGACFISVEASRDQYHLAGVGSPPQPR